MLISIKKDENELLFDVTPEKCQEGLTALKTC